MEMICQKSLNIYKSLDHFIYYITKTDNQLVVYDLYYTSGSEIKFFFKNNRSLCPCCFVLHRYTAQFTLDWEQSQTLFIHIFFFGIVKSDKGAELITFHILNIFIYFSRMVIGPGKRKALHH